MEDSYIIRIPKRAQPYLWSIVLAVGFSAVLFDRYGPKYNPPSNSIDEESKLVKIANEKDDKKDL